jgi:phosphopantetheinyl transferase
MKVYIANIEQISKKSDLSTRLSESELIQYNKFSNQKRKLQFLIGHAIVKDVCGENVKTDNTGAPFLKKGGVSISHKDNWVFVAISDKQVGIDIENMNKKRDFKQISRFLGLPVPDNKIDFYKNFTLTEALFKYRNNDTIPYKFFYKLNDYMICLVCMEPKENIEFTYWNESFSDVNSAVQFLCSE